MSESGAESEAGAELEAEAVGESGAASLKVGGCQGRRAVNDQPQRATPRVAYSSVYGGSQHHPSDLEHLECSQTHLILLRKQSITSSLLC